MRMPRTTLRILAAAFMAAGTVTLQAQQPAYQQPPVPPQVSYNAGQLSVTANNSTFADVLDAIQNAVGAKVEGLMPSSTERIFGQFGPAAPGAVLGEVLKGSPYDFIVVGGESGGGRVQQIILSPRSNASTHGMQMVPNTPRPANNDNANNNNNNGVVTDQFSYNDPQYAVPQYRAPVPAQQQQNNGQTGAPGLPGQNGQNQVGQNGQPGDQRTAPYRPQHYGALYSPTNPPPPPNNPNGVNPNAQPQQ